MKQSLSPLLLLVLVSGCTTLPGASDDPAALREEARLLWRVGRRDQAMATLERARAADPTDAETEVLNGALLHASGRIEEAIAHFRRASELAPESYAAHYGLGALLGELERYDEAETPLRRALDLRPRDVPALVLLAENAYRAERFADCRARYLEVIHALERRVTMRDDDRAIIATSIERHQLCQGQERGARSS